VAKITIEKIYKNSKYKIDTLTVQRLVVVVVFVVVLLLLLLLLLLLGLNTLL